MGMFNRFRQDAARWVVPQQVAPLEEITIGVMARLLYRHMPLRAMAWFRFGCWCSEHGIRGLPAMIQRRIYRHYGLEIGVGSDIEGGLYIAHPVGTVISAEHIGANCSIVAAVTIGMRNEHRFPWIGDNVFIGAGARVLGGITIGDNAKVGANAVVINDVAAGDTVVGMPARSVHADLLADMPS